MIGLSIDAHESVGINKVGYRFRLDLLLDRLFLLDSEAKVVGSLASEGQSSLKTVPESLPVYEVRTEWRWMPSPALLAGEGSHDETGEEAYAVVASELLRGVAVKRLGFQAAGRPMMVVSLLSPSLSLLEA